VVATGAIKHGQVRRIKVKAYASFKHRPFRGITDPPWDQAVGVILIQRMVSNGVTFLRLHQSASRMHAHNLHTRRRGQPTLVSTGDEVYEPFDKVIEEAAC